jgi:hypothetical protein
LDRITIPNGIDTSASHYVEFSLSPRISTATAATQLIQQLVLTSLSEVVHSFEPIFLLQYLSPHCIFYSTFSSHFCMNAFVMENATTYTMPRCAGLYQIMIPTHIFLVSSCFFSGGWVLVRATHIPPLRIVYLGAWRLTVHHGLVVHGRLPSTFDMIARRGGAWHGIALHPVT